MLTMLGTPSAFYAWHHLNQFFLLYITLLFQHYRYSRLGQVHKAELLEIAPET